MMMMYHYYRLIRLLELLQAKIRRQLKPLPYCLSCGLRYCDGTRCGFPPAPRWLVRPPVQTGDLRKSIYPNTYSISVERVPSLSRPIVVHHGTIDTISEQQAERLRKALDELAAQHRRWVRHQFMQLDAEQQQRDARLDVWAAVCEQESARLS